MSIAINPIGSKSQSQEGFTLIEAMIAILIFAIGILGAYKLQLHATEGNAIANRVSTATVWATFAKEEILGKHYTHIDLDDDDDSGWNTLDTMDGTADGVLYVQSDGSYFNKGDAGAPGNPLYTIYYNIAIGDGPGGFYANENFVLNDVKLIRVHVVRNGGIGDGHLYTHNYYKARWPESPE